MTTPLNADILLDDLGEPGLNLENVDFAHEDFVRGFLEGIILRYPEYYQADDQTESVVDLCNTLEKMVDRIYQEFNAEVEKLNAEIDELYDSLCDGQCPT